MRVLPNRRQQKGPSSRRDATRRAVQVHDSPEAAATTGGGGFRTTCGCSMMVRCSYSSLCCTCNTTETPFRCYRVTPYKAAPSI
ncbi:hypothetical protein Y032_0271g893 [Ancylostoma ceylanicum]|uniref:Uncharacterized protein n=1 Tax=Ancylostoma ceylanicum TaxID=53326 RepID=A0A016S8D4_9BILA|nr:hypothetical protein Y032_0271g893 [Ancylostoma ceylanicum]